MFTKEENLLEMLQVREVFGGLRETNHLQLVFRQFDAQGLMFTSLEVDELPDFGNLPVDRPLTTSEFMSRPYGFHIGVQPAHSLNRAWFRPQPTGTQLIRGKAQQGTHLQRLQPRQPISRRTSLLHVSGDALHGSDEGVVDHDTPGQSFLLDVSRHVAGGIEIPSLTQLG